MTVQALFIDPAGIYPELLSIENCWDAARDARRYAGTEPVVAHPPCNLWVNFAAQNYGRATAKCATCDGTKLAKHATGWDVCRDCRGTGRREPNRKVILPAWYPGGDDEGMFSCALMSVRNRGGVLEHPAGSKAWEAHGLEAPREVGWMFCTNCPGEHEWDYWVAEVWQSAYGHAARKRTWLLYCGRRPPFDLDWRREPGTKQVGWFDRNKPTVSKKEANATPRAFAETLIRLAEWSRG